MVCVTSIFTFDVISRRHRRYDVFLETIESWTIDIVWWILRTITNAYAIIIKNSSSKTLLLQTMEKEVTKPLRRTYSVPESVKQSVFALECTLSISIQNSSTVVCSVQNTGTHVTLKSN